MTEKFIIWTYVYNILSYVCIFVLFYLSDFVVFYWLSINVFI